LLLNLLNETSWPLFGGSGLLGSETPSVDVEAVEATPEPLVAAVDDPSREGGARGIEPAAAVLVVDGFDEELWVGPFIIFIVRGIWKASTPSSRTLPTARMTFCRLALALGSTFFFAISSSLRSGSRSSRPRVS
jgi:hypothetical protein